MQPGCVLRNNDWAVLQQQNLVTSAKVNECKQSLNTFAFTGKLENYLIFTVFIRMMLLGIYLLINLIHFETWIFSGECIIRS
jgi:hypothetical protein